MNFCVHGEECTVKKEMKCSENSDILHEIVRDTTQIRSCFSDFRVVSQTISCSISESPLHFKSFLTVGTGHGIPFSRIFPSLTHTMLLHQVGGREGRGVVLHFTSVIFGSASRYNSFKKYLCILAKSHQNMFPLHRGIRKTRFFWKSLLLV